MNFKKKWVVFLSFSFCKEQVSAVRMDCSYGASRSNRFVIRSVQMLSIAQLVTAAKISTFRIYGMCFEKLGE